MVVIINHHICNSDELEVTFEVETNFAKICWTRNPLGYLNHEGEVCDSVNENRKIEYSFEDLCSDEARRKQSSGYILCAPIFFRIEGNLLDIILWLMLIYINFKINSKTFLIAHRTTSMTYELLDENVK